LSKIEVNTVEPQCGTTLTLGGSGDTVQLGSGASQSGFGRTGTVDWDTTPKTATFTAVSGDGFFCNTTAGAFTCNLPAGTAGSIVSLADYAGTWQTNNLTVSPNGSQKIGGNTGNVILDTQGQSVTFIYVDDTQGWLNIQDSTSNERVNPFLIATGGTITTCGNFKIHTFTGPGTFTVSKVACSAANNIVDYLVVGGGGGGGSGFSSGAGGAGGGGFRYYANTTCNPQACGPALPINNFPSGTAITVTATGFPIAVGGGGAGAPQNGPTKAVGTNGVNSTFSTVTSAGGGGGGSEGGGSAPIYTGAAGGSGGGGGYHAGTGGSGAGNTPPVSPPQGNNGGTSATSSPDHASGGGGGATAVGTNGRAPAPDKSGNGGDGAGIPTAFGSNGESCGSFRYYAGGGGGGGHPPVSLNAGVGGVGGGASGSSSTGSNATDNTGGGGGSGGPAANGGNGGSGIVVIRYKFQ
jgi:hypothetical protein